MTAIPLHQQLETLVRGYAIARQPIGRDCLALDGLPASIGAATFISIR